MKTALLIIGLIFFGMMYGQKSITHVNDFQYGIIEYQEQDTIILLIATSEQAKWLIHNTDLGGSIALENRLRELYVEYCYADSVFMKEVWIPTETDSSIIIYEKYVTKKPHEFPTFEGYIEWLGNLLKEKP